MPIEFVKDANFVSRLTHQTTGSVGIDLFSTKNYSLSPIRPTLVNCGLSVNIPEGYFGLISGRSSLALKGVTAPVGIIDNDYKGCVCYFDKYEF